MADSHQKTKMLSHCHWNSSRPWSFPWLGIS